MSAALATFHRLREAYAYDDPFSWIHIPLVDEYVVPFTYGRISSHVHEIIATVLLYQTIFFLARLYLFANPSLNKTLNLKTRVDFCIRCVSMIQSILILALMIPVFKNEHLQKHTIFATTPYSGMVASAASGYFLWDSLTSLIYVNLFGVGYLIHGLVSSVVFLIGVSGYIHYYAPIFLLFEISTPFLNIRWFALKFPHRFSPTVELANNTVLILLFFFVRILWGWYHAYHLALDFYNNSSDPRFNAVYSITIMSCNVVLDILNVYWFSKMLVVAITTLKKMFKGDQVDDTKLKLM